MKAELARRVKVDGVSTSDIFLGSDLKQAFDKAEDDGIDPRLTASNVLWAAQHKIYQLANSNEHAEQIITNMAKQISETMQAMEVLLSDDEKKEIH